MNQFIGCLIVMAVLTPGLKVNAQSNTQTRPNIILFLVDDMGWQDTSVPFWDSITSLNKRFHTPNMERLAREGMKFTSAYAAPLCTATRVSLMTGMNVAHHRVSNYTQITVNMDADLKDSIFDPVPWNKNGFNPLGSDIPFTVHATALPQLLKDAGYFTIHVGKAHWGPIGTPASNPHNLGFTVNIGGHGAGHPQSYLGTKNFGNAPHETTYYAVPDLEEYYGSDVFLTEALTRQALRALDQPVSNKQPFFLNLAHYAVHTPIQADQRYFEKYLKMGVDTIEARYASLVEGMDKSLGDIMDYLKEKNIEKNTIVIFMSDNGGYSLRSKPIHTHNLPLRAGKGSLYEGGIREPMIVKWPGVTKPGSKAGQYIMVEDFFPTILQLAGVRNPRTIQHPDGLSFVPILKNSATADSSRIMVWHFPNKWLTQDGPAINYASAIRQGRWKLIYKMRNGTFELYDIRKDIREEHNISGEFPSKVTELAQLLTEKLKKWDAVMPVYTQTGKAVQWPDQMIK